MNNPLPNRMLSPGMRLRLAIEKERPLQVVGAINALHAKMAQRIGYQAIYLSGGGVAASALGLPDLGISTLEDVLIETRRITDSCDLPLIVDADTGFGSAFNIARTVRGLIKAGAAACHLEDQVQTKRCGHRPGKAIVSREEMVDRIKAAVDARSHPDFMVIARTDAVAVEGVDAAIDRARAFVEAGADMIFPEAATNLDTYRRFAAAVTVPVVANITEFGLTPLFTVGDLADADVRVALYPLSAFRAMNKAANQVYETIRAEGGQRNVVPMMQTRAELYELLAYDQYEAKLDALFAQATSERQPD